MKYQSMENISFIIHDDFFKYYLQKCLYQKYLYVAHITILYTT